MIDLPRSIKVALAAACLFGVSTTATALTIVGPNPHDAIPTGVPPPDAWGNESSNSQILALVAAAMNCDDLISFYKQNYNGAEEGSFADNYMTTFAGDPNDATITHVGGAAIAGYDAIWLIVKDGNQNPDWYAYDISGWNGTEVIQLTGFWLGNGAISHVEIVGCDPVGVPDGGFTVMLLGLGLASVGAARRFSTQ